MATGNRGSGSGGKRAVFHSAPSKTGKGWDVTSGGEIVSHHLRQDTAEDAATQAGRAVRAAGGKAQAVLHKADGTIREERTYGDDPARTPG